MNECLKFVVAVLFTFRLTHLLVFDYGPGHVFERLREIVGVIEYENGMTEYRTWVAELFGCHWCMSVWIALIPAIWFAGLTIQMIFSWLAIAGAASLLEELHG